MYDPRRLDLCVQWNEDYDEEWVLLDDAGLPIPIIDYTADLHVKANAGAPGAPLIVAANTTDQSIQGVVIISPENGWLRVQIRRASLQAVSHGQGFWRGAYDLLLTDNIGLQRVRARGAFTIEPGVVE